MKNKIDAEWAFRRYEEIRDRLPTSAFPAVTEYCPDLAAIKDRFDVFIFDSFGVLNVGETAIEDASVCVQALRRDARQVWVLTNSAGLPLASAEAKYKTFGFDFKVQEIIQSRALLAAEVSRFDSNMCWAVIAPDSAEIAELPCCVIPFDDEVCETADGFILLSSSGWTERRQHGLKVALARRPRPVLVGNPDLVAPREDGFSLQMGSYAHDLVDALGIEPVFFGKPYGNAFEAVLSRIGPDVARDRILMIGDTLHTDILGAASMGLKTALVTAHGVLQGLDVDACISESGIRPDFILPSI